LEMIETQVPGKLKKVGRLPAFFRKLPVIAAGIILLLIAAALTLSMILSRISSEGQTNELAKTPISFEEGGTVDVTPSNLSTASQPLVSSQVDILPSQMETPIAKNDGALIEESINDATSSQNLSLLNGECVWEVKQGDSISTIFTNFGLNTPKSYTYYGSCETIEGNLYCEMKREETNPDIVSEKVWVIIDGINSGDCVKNDGSWLVPEQQ
jgi:hypothetical protein